ncbi:MAG TPA: hypothetical protein VM286_06000 [Candidatus Thermoplasmatota archaeon]|nr:hypothetical protein [Candidatus Thermoplasmatota archaeon]
MTAATGHAPMPTRSIADASLRAARKMGLSRLFLQMVAQEVPDSALVGLRIEDTPGLTVARAAHACDADCDLSAHHCITALKLQALVGRQRRNAFLLAQLAAEGSDIRVHLVPLARPA